MRGHLFFYTSFNVYQNDTIFISHDSTKLLHFSYQINWNKIRVKSRYLQFILMATECFTGEDTLLFCAWQVKRTPLSDLLRSLRMTLEVTVEPEETSEVDDKGRPDQNQRTWGIGRPEIKEEMNNTMETKLISLRSNIFRTFNVQYSRDNKQYFENVSKIKVSS